MDGIDDFHDKGLTLNCIKFLGEKYSKMAIVSWSFKVPNLAVKSLLEVDRKMVVEQPLAVNPDY